MNPFCLTGLLFKPSSPPSCPTPFFLFLEEVDPLPRLNENLAPSSTQILLADKLEVGSGL